MALQGVVLGLKIGALPVSTKRPTNERGGLLLREELGRDAPLPDRRTHDLHADGTRALRAFAAREVRLPHAALPHVPLEVVAPPRLHFGVEVPAAERGRRKERRRGHKPESPLICAVNTSSDQRPWSPLEP